MTPDSTAPRFICVLCGRVHDDMDAHRLWHAERQFLRVLLRGAHSPYHDAEKRRAAEPDAPQGGEH